MWQALLEEGAIAHGTKKFFLCFVVVLLNLFI
jgi:hypothetical protein